jgi:serine/threonine-protein kinase HipA
MADQTEVHVEIGEETVLAGHLWTHRRGRAESATFAYEDSYLSSKISYPLDPALPLMQGRFQTPVDRKLFGAFSDCAPDRWGRRLMERAIRREGGGPGARSLSEHDYLLGVRDDMRQGAIRFRDPDTHEFLAPSERGIPYLVDLRPLLDAAERLERDDETAQEIRDLFRAGSSLGGARPKASVRLPDETIAIAKFPSAANDEWDVIGWEAVALDIAERAGMDTPVRELHRVEGKRVLVINRFDRVGSSRVGYVSAMTMLEAGDGDDDHSYLELADVLAIDSPRADLDLRELWRRVTLSRLISNTDDHLRNHGFLRLDTAGWSLAPIFDVNPNPRGDFPVTTMIPGKPETVAALIELAEFCRMTELEVRGELARIVSAVSGWESLATRRGLDRGAINSMRPAFEHEFAAEASVWLNGDS